MSPVQPVRTRPADWIFALAWLAAIVPAIVYLRDLRWPCDVDGMRELAIAESIVRGRWFVDPLYAGEAPWYPPLVAASLHSEAVAALNPPFLASRPPRRPWRHGHPTGDDISVRALSEL
jgi:hypothetical protein